MSARVLHGDCRELLATLEPQSVQCCVTSPPYWALRDYKVPPTVWGGVADCAHIWGPRRERHDERAPSAVAGKTRSSERFCGAPSRRFDGNHQKHTAGTFCDGCGAWLGCLGMEPTSALYVAHLVEVFMAVWRVLRQDGTLWLNIADSFANKNLQGIPWRTALALQDAGWTVRADVIWSKPNAMPSSVTDRPTTAHEYVFLFSKQARYYYDATAIAEPAAAQNHHDYTGQRYEAPGQPPQTGSRQKPPPVYPAWEERKANGAAMRRGDPGQRGDRSGGSNGGIGGNGLTRNARSVWTIATQPYTSGRPDVDHYAAFPEALAERCILAGTSAKGACPACGAPWRRVVERTEETPASFKGSTFTQGKTGVNGMGRVSGLPRGGRRDAGWEPTCRCGREDVVPCVVLDPCGGTGTTGRVALRHGRGAVLIDLNPAYLDLQEDRMTGVQMSMGSVL